MIRFLFLTFFLTNVSWAQISYVPMGKVLRARSYEIKATGRMWSSASRYDVDGEEFPYENGEAFSFMETELQGLYGSTNEFQLGLTANIRQNRADIEEPASSGTIESMTSTGMQAIGATLTYAFKPEDRLHYTLEGFYRYHPYTNTLQDPANRTKNFVLGDDGGDYGAGIVMTYAHPSDNYLGGRFHYRRPGSELSPEFNWQLEGALAFKYLALVAGVQGVKSLNQDAYTDNPAGKPALNTGGSQMYNSINREYIAPYAGLNIALGKNWRLEGRFQVVTQARSYDTGSMISIALARRTEPDKARQVDDAFKEYEIEATVVRLSPKKQFVIIDKGLSADVQKGQRFDLFHFDYLGGNVLLARAVVIQVNADQAVLKLTSQFSTQHEIKEGTIARGHPK